MPSLEVAIEKLPHPYVCIVRCLAVVFHPTEVPAPEAALAHTRALIQVDPDPSSRSTLEFVEASIIADGDTIARPTAIFG